eukprot:TRINITY_DN2584_c0_g1_i1.p1 TRINITY_DN2584_c0_g1~~TRINITY_DN2584_c0_g1_i1.p1  ORF type:complete len:168 (+),score=48.60 TRINITY_DN2584_c0_g1_i1:47-550(+)
MSTNDYLTCVKASLIAAFSIQNHSSIDVDRHNRPEVEISQREELLLNPILIPISNNQKVLIESSVNSTRISVAFSKADDVDQVLYKQYLRFLMARAETLFVLRKKPIEGFDVSFLITNNHIETYMAHKMADFVVEMIEDIPKQISQIQSNVTERFKASTEYFLKNLS